jgi:Holliday junction DNA helicase RuvA
MFYYIKGTAALKGANFAVIDAGGVGYRVFTSSTSLARIETGSQVTMYTYMYVREDIMNIYGFSTSEELSMFEHLISVNGVGPKAALAILSAAPPERFALAVVTGDTKLITKAQGVGPKLAQRIILELKDKMKTEDMPSAVSDIIAEDDMSDSLSEAVAALVVLGYTQQEASAAVAKCSPTDEVELIVKQALKNLLR